jgi:hypothetical protein
MATFSRSWTQSLKTDREGFKSAFFKVVNSRDYNIPHSHRIDYIFGIYVFRKYAIGEDCWGSVYTESFNIHKLTKRGYSKRLDGKMIEDTDGLKLELKLHAGYYELLVFIRGFFLAVFLCYFFYYLFYVPFGGRPFVVNTYLWVTCFILPGLILSSWAGFKAQQRHMNKLKRYFTTVLNEIEKHAVNNRK